jgi:hypothetical protein
MAELYYLIMYAQLPSLTRRLTEDDILRNYRCLESIIYIM